MQRKRPRISDAESVKENRRPRRPSTPSLDSDSDDDDTHGARDRTLPASPDSPPKTQYELLRDNNFEHLRHEADDDQRATQRLRFRPNLFGDNAAADNGIIESITCVNFMCHQRLHCELGPLLNFIVGENGSGKSAILTAITLCLGGKASSTNRGGSLKSFVKEGQERAVLSVKIKNQGDDAYRHDIYGDSIVVERHFSKSGSSGFKVKTALGQVYCTKKQEVEEIVEYYALQVDNPLNVLSQDNARQFLNSSTKAQKYKFFIEGVQLQQLDNDYRLISESLEQMMAKVPDQEERVKHARGNLTKAKQLKKAVEGNAQIRLKHRVLRNQIVWAQVITQERELAKRENLVAETDIKIAEAQREREEKSQALQIVDEKIERVEENLLAIKEDKPDIEGEIKLAEELFAEAKKELAAIHVDEREAHTSLRAASDNVKDLVRKIKAEEKRLEDANGEVHASKTRELEDANTKVQRIEDEITDNKSREPELINQVDGARKKLDKVEMELRQKQKEKASANTKLDELKKSTGGLYDGYDRQMPRLVNMIAQERGFSQKPIGPLGTHIKLLKPQWSSILENTLNKSLSAFIVSCVSDSRILRRMMDSLGFKNPEIIIAGRTSINLAGKEPDESFDTILRVLKIDNQLVRDQMIISGAIEQVLLVPESSQAENVMFDGAPPRNVRSCLTFHPLRRGQGLRLVNKGGNISTDPVQPNPHLRARMQTDTGTQVAYQDEICQSLAKECSALETNKRLAQQDVVRLDAELRKLKKDRTLLETKLRHARVDVDNIQGELDQFDGVDGRLQGLREQLADAEAKKEHNGLQYGTLVNKKKEKNKNSEDAFNRVEEKKLHRKDYIARLEKVEAKMQGLSETRRIILTELNEVVSGVDLYKEEREHLENKVERQREHVASITAEASRLCPRMHLAENETYAGLEKKYETLGRRLKEEEAKMGMTEQQILDYLEEAKKTYDKAVSDLTSITEVNTGLKNTLRMRLDKWRKFQRFISSQSRANFLYLLSERGFRGKLLLDHENKTLDLQVEPDKTEKRAVGRNTKTLSGGEKSFSSICLLLSIWEAMGSPLRCLDEFDVFMDNVNRAISTNMLVSNTLFLICLATLCVYIFSD